MTNSILFAECGYNLDKLLDAQDKVDISNWLVWMNSPNLVGKVTRAFLAKLQVFLRRPTFLGSTPQGLAKKIHNLYRLERQHRDPRSNLMVSRNLVVSYPEVSTPPASASSEPRQVFTDGSLGSCKQIAGCASMRSPWGTMSSTTPEIGGILLALLSTPRNSALTINTDLHSAIAKVSSWPKLNSQWKGNGPCFRMLQN
jgi:hypothetical protein